jgi:SPRY domain
MLVCSVSLSRRRAAIAAGVVEAAAALDAPGTGNVVFATLVDDPASVGDHVDAFLGQIMLEAANATATVSAGSAYAAAVAEAASAAATTDAGRAFAANIAETLTANDAPDATATAGFAATTFDAASVTNVTLSNGNLTATHSNTTTNSGARSTSAKTSGKYYFEVTVTTTHGTADCMGILTTAGTYTNLVTNGTNCMVSYKAAGNIFSNNVSSGKSLGVIASGDVIGVAVDLTARKGWLCKNAGNWNGDATHDPATGAGGVTLPATVAFAPVVGFGGGSTSTNDAMTANFGATTFTRLVPSGFTAGWPA